MGVVQRKPDLQQTTTAMDGNVDNLITHGTISVPQLYTQVEVHPHPIHLASQTFGFYDYFFKYISLFQLSAHSEKKNPASLA